MNQFLATVPFDLYELALFHLVVKHRSFTKAAALAGLTQSAITRQIQGIESALGVELLKRTTRSIALTPAGQYLASEAIRLLGDVESTLRLLQQDYANAPKEVRVNVSRSVGLAYLPGFFHANLRKVQNVTYRLHFSRSDEILLALEADEQDIGVLNAPRRLPPTLRVTHRFQDVFTFVAPVALAAEYFSLKKNQAQHEWLVRQKWLIYAEESNTGKELRQWLRREGLRLNEQAEFDNFDLIINLVSLGMGCSIVPVRALALYAHKKTMQRLPYDSPLVRELVVLVRKRQKPAAHVSTFVSHILF
ncbi:MAG TPA: LysR family transcriptional regulator [Verrucomicrobiae bacterium]